MTASRQYCDVCSSEFPITNWAPRISAILFAIVLVAGAKVLFFPNTVETGSSERPAATPFRQENPARLESKNAAELPKPAQNTTNSGNALNLRDQRVKNPEKPDAVFYCGAPTKKGTPCTRRVKSKGYCWQHRRQMEH